jgi:hypothetical protein
MRGEPGALQDCMAGQRPPGAQRGSRGLAAVSGWWQRGMQRLPAARLLDQGCPDLLMCDWPLCISIYMYKSWGRYIVDADVGKNAKKERERHRHIIYYMCIQFRHDFVALNSRASMSYQGRLGLSDSASPISVSGRKCCCRLHFSLITKQVLS